MNSHFIPNVLCGQSNVFIIFFISITLILFYFNNNVCFSHSVKQYVLLDHPVHCIVSCHQIITSHIEIVTRVQFYERVRSLCMAAFEFDAGNSTQTDRLYCIRTQSAFDTCHALCYSSSLNAS